MFNKKYLYLILIKYNIILNYLIAIKYAIYYFEMYSRYARININEYNL